MIYKRFTKPKAPRLVRKSRVRMPQLTIGDKVARLPIVQGGMGVGISLSGLASAVANSGGVGVIAANAVGMLEPDYYSNGREANLRALRKQIRTARAQTDGLIGVNIMVAVNDYHDLLNLAIDERVDLVFLGAGLPLKGMPVDELQNAGVKVVPIVSSGRAAKLIFSYWQKNYHTVPDAVVVEGPKAGGHLGFKPEQIDDPGYSLEKLVPEVVKEIDPFEKQSGKSIPVIAAGGIYNGDDIYRFFKLGASGVQMATRFVATRECDADPKFKESYINCNKEDITIINSPVGLPGRAIRNHFLDEVSAGDRKVVRCPWRCLGHCGAKKAQYCISEALNNARQGKMEGGYAFAGANAYKVEKIVPVKSLVRSIKREYLRTVVGDTAVLRQEFEEAFKQLAALKGEYTKTVKKSAKELRTELEAMLARGSAVFKDELRHAQKKIDALKEEYAEHFDKVNELKDQLSRFLDTTKVKMPTPVIC